jgi:hypothetical protein
VSETGLLTRPKPRYVDPFAGRNPGYTVTVEPPKPKPPEPTFEQRNVQIEAQVKAFQARGGGLAARQAKVRSRTKVRGAGIRTAGSFFSDAGIENLVQWQLANTFRALDDARAKRFAGSRQLGSTRQVRITRRKEVVSSVVSSKQKGKSLSTLKTNPLLSPVTTTAKRVAVGARSRVLSKTSTGSTKIGPRTTSTRPVRPSPIAGTPSLKSLFATPFLSALRTPVANRSLTAINPAVVTSSATRAASFINVATKMQTASASQAGCKPCKKDSKKSAPKRECVQRVTEVKEVSRCLQYKSK